MKRNVPAETARNRRGVRAPLAKALVPAVLAALFLLSACSAVETAAETNPTETAPPSAEQTAATGTETSRSAEEKPVEAEEPTDTPSESADAAEAEDEYGIMTLPLYIDLSVTDLTDGIAALQIDNHSGREIEYDLHFALEREVQPDVWERLEPAEDIPAEEGSWLLPDQQQATILCDLNAYGDLPDGHYRMEKDDLYAEFTLADGALAEE